MSGGASGAARGSSSSSTAPPAGLRFDLTHAEARHSFASRLRTCRREEKDRALGELFEELQRSLTAIGRSKAAELAELEGWNNEGARDLHARLRALVAQTEAAGERRAFERRYREITRERRKADDFETCRESGYEVRHQSGRECGTKIYQPFSCDIRGCPRCGSRRVARLVELYTKRIEALFSVEPWRSRFGVYALTLTTRHERRGELPGWREMESVLKAGSFVGRQHFSSGERGWLFAMELGSRSYMSHLHWIVIAEKRKPFKRWPISIEELNVSWKSACERFGFPGEGGFGYIDPVNRTGEALRENVAHICKYISKPMSFAPELFADLFLRVPANARWIRSGGVLHSGKKPTLRQVTIALALRDSSYPAPEKLDDLESVERADRLYRTRAELAAARRRELDDAIGRWVDPFRCPTCGDLLFVDYSAPLSRLEREAGYVELRECRPPPLR